MKCNASGPGTVDRVRWGKKPPLRKKPYYSSVVWNKTVAVSHDERSIIVYLSSVRAYLMQLTDLMQNHFEKKIRKEASYPMVGQEAPRDVAIPPMEAFVPM